MYQPTRYFNNLHLEIPLSLWRSDLLLHLVLNCSASSGALPRPLATTHPTRGRRDQISCSNTPVPHVVHNSPSYSSVLVPKSSLRRANLRSQIMLKIQMHPPARYSRNWPPCPFPSPSLAEAARGGDTADTLAHAFDPKDDNRKGGATGATTGDARNERTRSPRVLSGEIKDGSVTIKGGGGGLGSGRQRG